MSDRGRGARQRAWSKQGGGGRTKLQDDRGQPVDLVASRLRGGELRAVPRRVTVGCALLASPLWPDLVPQPAERASDSVVCSGLEHVLPLCGWDVEARQLCVSERLHQFLERG